MKQIGYCTNVHAGPDLSQTRENLQKHAEEVKRRYSPTAPMGVGLWLAAPAASQLRSERQAAEFADYLSESGLIPFTLNGFPYGDFHQDVVKHAVYQPTWMDPRRLQYTRDLIAVLDQLLPKDLPGSISTLPVAWGDVRNDEQAMTTAAKQLAAVAADLADLESRNGRCICVCIEPEPGCVMDRAEHIIEFFDRYLLPAGDPTSIRRHLRVCHDVCHSAVMFETQSHALQGYRDAGIQVGKVQVSSAVSLPLDELEPDQRQAAIAQLAEFNEPRYLHQTTHDDGAGQRHFYEDLAPALMDLRDVGRQRGELRVHFHVPVYLTQFGDLRTTQSDVLECLRHVETDHFEVETYAWGVLPPELQQPSLAAGIAEELQWFTALL